ncbi:MAG: hypothetical protein KGH71_02360 [Candidatus Micrarchaeota archaeon]|nr:hypothetical protein [Candidatus Micrarchaeota archaeon]
MPELSQKEKVSVALAALVVVLTLIAIIVFVYTGAGLIFYLTAIVSVILGFYITYSISKMEQEPVKSAKK